MNYLSNLLAVSVVSFLGAVSPGPDFAVVVKNSLSYSRRAGMLTACGIALALLVHLSYTIFGIGLLASEEALPFLILKYLGAAYLFYLGFKSFAASFQKQAPIHFMGVKQLHNLSSLQAIKQGFFTNLLNPKCALFFISFFAQFVVDQTPISIKISYGLINWTITLAWFLFLSFLITGNKIFPHLTRYRSLLDRLMGIALIILSIKILVF